MFGVSPFGSRLFWLKLRKMPELGEAAPAFTLKDNKGNDSEKVRWGQAG